MIVIWAIGQSVTFLGPMLVGIYISDKRRDDSSAAYKSIGVGVLTGFVYFLVSVAFLLI